LPMLKALWPRQLPGAVVTLASDVGVPGGGGPRRSPVALVLLVMLVMAPGHLPGTPGGWALP
jgi:hypothetical protein